jgi:hypothetical protein
VLVTIIPKRKPEFIFCSVSPALRYWAENYFGSLISTRLLFICVDDCCVDLLSLLFCPRHQSSKDFSHFFARFFRVNLVVCFDSILPKYTSALLFSGINPSSERHRELFAGCWSLLTSMGVRKNFFSTPGHGQVGISIEYNI